LRRNPLICTMTEGYQEYPKQLLGCEIYHEDDDMSYVMAINPKTKDVYDIKLDKIDMSLEEYEQTIIDALKKELSI
jgi:hypothetical protein